jgi:hypothetical protein
VDSRRLTDVAGDVLERGTPLARLNPSSRLKETLADLLTQVQACVRIGETENIGQGILDRAPDEDGQLFF